MQAELDKVVGALGAFYARETHLLEKDLGERTLTHRLAVYLESRFTGWDVDCDYNRLGERRLRLPKGSIVSTDDDSGKSVYPDIVVHRRAVPENLLAIELRKADSHQPPDHDRHKLRAMTDPHLLARLSGRGAAGAGAEARGGVGGLCRRHRRFAAVDLAGRTAEGG
jgi:hypothetical protein